MQFLLTRVTDVLCGTLRCAFCTNFDNCFIFNIALVFWCSPCTAENVSFGEIIFILRSWTLNLVPAYTSTSLLCLKLASKHLEPSLSTYLNRVTM